VQYRRQCLSCGQGVGNAARKDVAMAETNGNPEPFDEAFLKCRSEAANAERIQQLQAESDEWWVWYNQYLLSDAWKTRRRLVIERCRNLCEGCASRSVTEVHHKTYEHVGRELLFELVGLCDRCHSIAHQDNINAAPQAIRMLESELRWMQQEAAE
jgi:5-methylcytosine-specific restriction endonuclease McrA